MSIPNKAPGPKGFLLASPTNNRSPWASSTTFPYTLCWLVSRVSELFSQSIRSRWWIWL